jgi:hypothetical protein
MKGLRHCSIGRVRGWIWKGCEDMAAWTLTEKELGLMQFWVTVDFNANKVRYRYHDTPVGSYDEILIVPGKFEVGEEGKKRDMLRVTMIYVSQRGTLWNGMCRSAHFSLSLLFFFFMFFETCGLSFLCRQEVTTNFNLIVSIGRKNWNIPKHLANFTFTTLPSGTTELSLSPPNSTKPFLKLNLTPLKYIPAIPFSTNSAKWIGMDLRLAQPPLPSATGTKSDKGEGAECLCGTEEWKVACPEIWGRARGCWVDVDFEPTASASEETPLLAEAEGEVGQIGGKGWWPRYRPWSVGVFIEEGRRNFTDGVVEGVTK